MFACLPGKTLRIPGFRSINLIRGVHAEVGYKSWCAKRDVVPSRKRCYEDFRDAVTRDRFLQGFCR